MIALALFLIALGAFLSHRAQVFVLIPVTILAWIAAAHFARLDAFSLMQTLTAAFLCGASLQLGYLAGAVLATQRIARRKSISCVNR
jgi:hypothetical protein